MLRSVGESSLHVVGKVDITEHLGMSKRLSVLDDDGTVAADPDTDAAERSIAVPMAFAAKGEADCAGSGPRAEEHEVRDFGESAADGHFTMRSLNISPPPDGEDVQSSADCPSCEEIRTTPGFRRRHISDPTSPCCELHSPTALEVSLAL